MSENTLHSDNLREREGWGMRLMDGIAEGINAHFHERNNQASNDTDILVVLCSSIFELYRHINGLVLIC